MTTRAWMIPVLPIAAIAMAWGIVIGIALLNREDDDARGRRTAHALDAAFDRILSEKDWVAAGFPSERSEFGNFNWTENPDWFESERSLGKKRGLRGSLRLSIRPLEDVRIFPSASVEGARESSLLFAEGFESESREVTRSWHVAARRVEPDSYEELEGRCFHDGVSVTVKVSRAATASQAEGFKRMIEAASRKLATACEGELRTYVLRVEAKAKTRQR
jgi:hypothetical protein